MIFQISISFFLCKFFCNLCYHPTKLDMKLSNQKFQ